MPLKTTTGGHHVVLLHGWASHAQVFRSLARALEKNFHVQVMPLPGYSDTAACTPYTLERIADTLAASAPKQCSVVGWSLGAQVALMWGRRAPAQVNRLALIAATPCFTQRADWPHAAARDVMHQFAAAIKHDCPGVLRRFVALQSLGDTQQVRVAHRLRSAVFLNALPTLDVLESGLEILRATDLRALLPSIQQPVLVLHGERDAVTPCAAGKALSDSLPNARFQMLPGAGHAPFLSDLNAVATMLQEFLHEPAPAIRTV